MVFGSGIVSNYRSPVVPSTPAVTYTSSARSASPRLSPRDVIRSAHQTLRQNQPRRMPSRKGRPPSAFAPTVSTLSTEARSFLARAQGDVSHGIDRADGFGVKVATPREEGARAELLSLFGGGSIPQRLRPTPQELEVAVVKEIVRAQTAVAEQLADNPVAAAAAEAEAEAQSLAMLSGLLSKTTEAMDKAEEAMKEEKKRQRALEKEMRAREEGAGPPRPGVRPNRRRRKRKGAGEEEASTAAGADSDDDGDDDGSSDTSSSKATSPSATGEAASSGGEKEDEDAPEGEGAGGEGRDDGAGGKREAKRHSMKPTVTQGFADLYPWPEPPVDSLSSAAPWGWEEVEVVEEREEKEEGDTGDAGDAGDEMDHEPRTKWITQPRPAPPTANRLCRLLSSSDRSAEACAQGSEATGAPHKPRAWGDDTAWPEVGEAEIVALLRRMRFFRQAELKDEVLATVAGWLEVQRWERGQTVAEEGTWCHSFAILAHGTLEARGRLLERRAPPPPKKTRSKGAKGLAALGDGSGAGERGHDKVASRPGEADGSKRQTKRGPPTLLPVPTLTGAFETLAPMILYPGATIGELSLSAAALPLSQASLSGVASGRFPNTCSVRTLSRCTLLVLRRTRPLLELRALPITARLGWEDEARRLYERAQVNTTKWLLHSLRRLPLLQPLRPALVRGLQRLAQYRVVPGGTCLYRMGEPVGDLIVLLQGQVGIYVPSDGLGDECWAGGRRLDGQRLDGQRLDGQGEHDEDDNSTPPLTPPPFTPPELLRRVTDGSRVPLIGDAPLMLPTATEAKCKPPCEAQAMTLTETQLAILPYAELCRRPALFGELRGRVKQLRDQPSRLMAALGVSAVSPRADAGATKAAAEQDGTPTRAAKKADGLISKLISRDRPTGAILQGGSRPTSRVNSPDRPPDALRAQTPGFPGASREPANLA